jgi:citrate synthase
VAERLLAAATSTHDPPRARVRAVDTVLVTFADVALSPPTFAALVVASCKADLPSALLAHLAAADGTRSLGAARTLGEWLDPDVPIGAIEVAVQRAVMEKRIIPGFGNRILPATDTRVAILERAVEELRESGDGAAHPPRRVDQLINAYDTIVATAARPFAAEGIGPNALLPATLLLRLTGVPASAITPILAVASIAGTLARIDEHAADARIFRPLDRYLPEESGGSP